ncbi:2-aminoadipate transaminase [compost metagenome]
MSRKLSPVPQKSLPVIPNAGRRAELLTEQLERRLPVRPGDGRLPPDWLDPADLRRQVALPKLVVSDSYNSSWGFLPLRESIASTLGERGIQCGAEQISTTYGGNNGLDLIIRCYVRPGDVVLVDEPGYYPLFWKLAVAGANIVGVKRLHQGPDLDDLELKARELKPRLFFTQSLAHNPMGGSITSGVAYGILKVAEANGLLVVEDDPFADLLPSAAPRLAALDQLNRVIYVGSFSKTLPGSFRVGFVAASPAIASEINEMKVITMISTSAQNERLVHALIQDARYLKYLRRLSERLSEATSITVKALETRGFAVQRPTGGGFYVWVDLPPKMRRATLAAEAAAKGIFIATSEVFMVKHDAVTGMRINVAHGADTRFLQWLGEWR